MANELAVCVPIIIRDMHTGHTGPFRRAAIAVIWNLFLSSDLATVKINL
jgi:hypothetical protein